MGTEGCGHFWVRADLGVGLGWEGRWVGISVEGPGEAGACGRVPADSLEGGPFVEPWQWLQEAWRGLQLGCSLHSWGLTGSKAPGHHASLEEGRNAHMDPV